MVLSTLQTVGLLIGIAYYLIIMRNSQRAQQIQLETRQAQLFTHLYSDFRRPENIRLIGRAMQMNWSDYDDFQIKYNSTEHAEDRMPYSSWSMYFQEIGVLVKEGLIDISLVAQFLPDAFRDYWKKFKPIILEHRERADYPQYFAGMEHLYNEFSRHRGHQLGI